MLFCRDSPNIRSCVYCQLIVDYKIFGSLNYKRERKFCEDKCHRSDLGEG